MTLLNSKECPHCGEFFVPGGAWAQHTRSCANGGSKRRRRTQYREIFFAYNGPGPYGCYFECGNPVEFSEVIVHHVDIDHTNTSIDNLVPCHRLCHNGYHLRLQWVADPEGVAARLARQPHSEESKAKISASKRGVTPNWTPEGRARIAAAHNGVPHTQETKAKMSDYAKNRTPEHQEKLNAAQVGRVFSEETRRKMSESAKARSDRKKKS